jgi:hypothetical protein
MAKAHAAHKGDETKVNDRLPPGIEGGVARIVQLAFGNYKSGDYIGEPYFIRGAVAIAPETFSAVDQNGKPAGTFKVAGQRLQTQTEPLCDTKIKTGDRAGETISFDEHYANMLNDLRKLGINTKDIREDDNIETTFNAIFAQLLEDKVCFRFRTWKGKPTPQYPNPRTNEEWGMNCPEPAEEGSSVLDESSQNGAETETEPEAAAEASGGAAPWDSDSAEDILKMGQQADDESDVEQQAVAQEALNELAAKHDINPDEIDSWEEVAVAINAAREGGAQEEAAAEFVPKKGDVYLYAVKGSKKPVEVEVTAVFESKRTVNLINLTDKKTKYTQVAWDKLSE